jgi:formylglycine-generating enzyme required for sulfatase activity
VITAVTYYEAVHYCEERGLRLPSRSEWLVAAIGSTGWTLANSPVMDLTKMNRFDPHGIPGTNPEGEYPPNPFGLYDMSGNVAELNGPIHSYSLGGLAVQQVLISGGSWGSCKDSTVPYAYNIQDPLMRNDRVGFRVLKDAP